MGAMQIPEDKRALATKINTVEASFVPWGFAPAEPETAAAVSDLTGNFAIAEPIFETGPHPHIKPVPIGQAF
jgi:hypothetical protein